MTDSRTCDYWITKERQCGGSPRFEARFAPSRRGLAFCWAHGERLALETPAAAKKAIGFHKL